MKDESRKIAATRIEDFTLEEESYRADLQVNERAQVFATELARLGLLAIGGLGFLLINSKSGEMRTLGPAWMLWIAMPSLGVAVGTALLHRYFSTDCIVCQIAIVRLVKRLEHMAPTAPERQHLERSLAGRRGRQERDMGWCHRLTLWSAASLALGAAALAVMLTTAYTGYQSL